MTGHVNDLLSEFLDNALPEAERLAVERHLSACPSCAGELEELRSNVAALKAQPRKPLPPGFMARLEAKRAEPRRDWVFLPPPARVAAFALSSFIVAFVVLDRFRGDAPGTAGLERFAADAAAPQALSAPEPMPAPRPAALAKAAARSVAGVRGAAVGRKLDRPAPGRPILAEASAPAAPELAMADQALIAAERAEAYTNEEQFKKLEAEKAKLGIARIITPAEKRAERAAELATPQGFARAFGAASANMGGGAGVAVGEGSTVDLEAASRRKLAVRQAVAPFEGAVARDADELRAVWKDAELAGAPPVVDFAKHMVVVAPGAVVDARESAAMIVVRWKPGPRGHAVIARSLLPVAFELKKQ